MVSIDEEAKMFCANRLRNLSVEEPSEPARSADGVMLPAIWSLSVGADTPTPILPFDAMLNHDVPVDEATLNIVFVSPDVPPMYTSEDVDVVPIASAESQPVPIYIAVSVAEPGVTIEPMLIAVNVPVAAPVPVNGILIPLNIPPAKYVAGDAIFNIF